MSRLPAAVRAWRDSGRDVEVQGRRIFVRESGEGDVTIVVVHGFPGSSYDWAGVVPLLPGRVVAFDLPGHGLSDKSPEADYSLFTQADVVEALLAALGVARCRIVAHDMGDTVTAELAARATAGTLGFSLDAIVLTNGSIFIDLAQLTRGQRLTLRLPDRSLPVPMPGVVLRRSLAESFAPDAPAPDGAIDALVSLIREGRGDRLMPRLIRYIEERRRHQDRWTAGLVDFAGPLSVVWGERDPIAVLPMVDRLRTLRPDTAVVTLPDVGHWPSIEDPQRLAEEISRAIG